MQTQTQIITKNKPQLKWPTGHHSFKVKDCQPRISTKSISLQMPLFLYTCPSFPRPPGPAAPVFPEPSQPPCPPTPPCLPRAHPPACLQPNHPHPPTPHPHQACLEKPSSATFCLCFFLQGKGGGWRVLSEPGCSPSNCPFNLLEKWQCASTTLEDPNLLKIRSLDLFSLCDYSIWGLPCVSP